MSDVTHEPASLDLRAWIDQAAGDRRLRDQRQVVAVILNAVALVTSFRDRLVFKGGALLAVAHGSLRLTSDLDFTARDADPEEFAARFIAEMDRGLDRARARLGYVQWRCRVQGKLKLQPRNFAEDRFPALRARIGYAAAGTRDEAQLAAGNCTNVIDVEISFREPVIETQELQLVAANEMIEAYSLNEMIAEKLRAYLQQGIRNRRRRQDIYDVAYLVRRHTEDEEIDRATVLRALLEKCAARDVPVGRGLIDNPELIERARSEWATMGLELGSLPPFEECFNLVREFYLSLPWENATVPGVPDAGR